MNKELKSLTSAIGKVYKNWEDVELDLDYLISNEPELIDQINEEWGDLNVYQQGLRECGYLDHFSY